MIPLLEKFDEEIIPFVEKTLQSKGYDVHFYCSTYDCIDFIEEGDFSESIKVYADGEEFKVYIWTEISEDWAEFIYAFTMTKAELLS